MPLYCTMVNECGQIGGYPIRSYKPPQCPPGPEIYCTSDERISCAKSPLTDLAVFLCPIQSCLGRRITPAPDTPTPARY